MPVKPPPRVPMPASTTPDTEIARLLQKAYAQALAEPVPPHFADLIASLNGRKNANGWLSHR